MSILQIDEIKIEWDEKKSVSNKKKHSIDFRTAAYVFTDANRIEAYDEAHSYDEDRFFTIGIVERVIVVVYTMRGDTYRIISARLASRIEERMYYGNNKNYN